MTIEDRKLITMYFDRFGDKKPSELNFEKVYMCPNCKGIGTVYIQSMDGRDDQIITCKVCNGIGYTDRHKKPKMIQVGWEFEED